MPSPYFHQSRLCQVLEGKDRLTSSQVSPIPSVFVTVLVAQGPHDSFDWVIVVAGTVTAQHPRSSVIVLVVVHWVGVGGPTVVERVTVGWPGAVESGLAKAKLGDGISGGVYGNVDEGEGT